MFLAHPRRDYARPPEPDCDPTRPEYLNRLLADLNYQAPPPAAKPVKPTRWRWVWLAVLILLPLTVAFINGKG